MPPAINCKQGWIILITITRCTGKINSWRQPSMLLERILVPSSALGCPRTSSMGFQRYCISVCNKVGFYRVIAPMIYQALCPALWSPYFLITGETWEAKSCWVHCLRSHSLYVAETHLLPGSNYLFLLHPKKLLSILCMVLTAYSSNITKPRDPHFNDTAGAQRC